MRPITTAIIASAIVQLQGCAYSPQQAQLAPSIRIMKSDIGANTSVSLKVVDDRPSKSLGRRADTFGPAAEISADQELDDVIRGELVKSLVARGFKVVSNGETADAALKFEIRHFEYTMSQGWTFGLHVTGAIKAYASRDGEIYEKLYRSTIEENVAIVPTAATNEKVINKGLSKILNEMLEDDALFKSLANH